MTKEILTKGNNNPYLNGRRECLERYGSYIARAKQWRLIALLVIVALLISLSGNVMQIKQNKIVPYIIQVDKLGNKNSVGRADRLSTNAPQELIQAELVDFITNWRTVTADLDLQKRLVSKLSFFLAGGAKGQISEWFNFNNPYKTAEEGRLIHIDVKSLPLSVSKNSWRVEWTETVRSHTGIALQSITYEGIFKIDFKDPINDEQIMHNPGGIYITEISYSKLLNAANNLTPNLNNETEKEQ